MAEPLFMLLDLEPSPPALEQVCSFPQHRLHSLPLVCFSYPAARRTTSPGGGAHRRRAVSPNDYRGAGVLVGRITSTTACCAAVRSRRPFPPPPGADSQVGEEAQGPA